MKNYQISITQVSKERNRYFNVFVNGENIGETSYLKPSFGCDYGCEQFANNVIDNAYQMARRVIIHSLENDIDVFTKGRAILSLPNNIKWAE